MVDVGTAAQDAQSENDIAGNRPETGRFHVQILEADETCVKYDAALIQFQILAGNRDGQEGKTIVEKFFFSEASRARLHRFLLCIKIRPIGEVNMAETVGRQLIIEIEPNPYVDKKTGEDKMGIKVPYMGFWSVDNAEVSDVPKNAEMHAMWMEFCRTNPPATAPQPQQAAPVAPATAATAPAVAPAPVAEPVAQPAAQQPPAAAPPAVAQQPAAPAQPVADPAAAPAAAPVQQQQAPAPAAAPVDPPAAQPAAPQQQPPPVADPPADPYAALADL